MDASNGIDIVKTNTRRRKFDLFQPVSVKTDGRRMESANWCVRFQHQGKRTCRSLGTADFRLATQRAKQLVASVRHHGWTGAALLSAPQARVALPALLGQYHCSAVSRGLRPRSIARAEQDLRRVAGEIGVRRLNDLTPAALQQWIRDSRLKPITLRSILKNAGSVFARVSLQAMGMTELENPFARLVRPKLDREPFQAPSRAWMQQLMREGVKELSGEPRLGLVLALGAGLRWGEIVSLQWEDNQNDGVRVAASKAKGRRARVVPIGGLLRAVLEPARSQGGMIRTHPAEVHQTLCAWLRARGVKDAKPMHYLRKCFGSLAVGDHGIYVAAKLLGHSSITLTASTYAGQVDQLPAVKF